MVQAWKLYFLMTIFFFAISCSKNRQHEDYWKYDTIQEQKEVSKSNESTDSTDIVYFDFNYPHIVDGKKSEKINDYIKERLLFTDNNIDRDIQFRINNFVEEYRHQSDQKLTQDLQEVSTEVLIRMNDKNYCTFLFVYDLKDQFDNQIQLRRFLNYDTQKEREVLYTDIIQPNEEERFNTIVQLAFREHFGLSIEDEFLDHHFTFPGNRFYVPYDFLMDYQGLVFQYDFQEITSNKEGIVEIQIPYGHIKEILTKEARKKLKNYL